MDKIREWFAKAINEPITLFTILLVIVGVLQWRVLANTDDTLRLQQRAWVTPLGVSLRPDHPITAGKDIVYVLAFANRGREPAQSLNVTTQNDFIEPFDVDNSDMIDVKVPKNTSCERNQAESGRFNLAPTGENVASALQESTAFGNPRYIVDDRLVAGSKFFVLQGCVKYKTLDIVRYSTFCYVLEHKLPSAYTFQTCGRGFDSD